MAPPSFSSSLLFLLPDTSSSHLKPAAKVIVPLWPGSPAGFFCGKLEGGAFPGRTKRLCALAALQGGVLRVGGS